MSRKFDQWAKTYEERKLKSEQKQHSRGDYLAVKNRTAKQAFWWGAVVPYSTLNTDKAIIIQDHHVKLDDRTTARWFDPRDSFDESKVREIQSWCNEMCVKLRSVNFVTRDDKTHIAFVLKRYKDSFHFKLVWG